MKLLSEGHARHPWSQTPFLLLHGHTHPLHDHAHRNRRLPRLCLCCRGLPNLCHQRGPILNDLYGCNPCVGALPASQGTQGQPRTPHLACPCVNGREHRMCSLVVRSSFPVCSDSAEHRTHRNTLCYSSTFSSTAMVLPLAVHHVHHVASSWWSNMFSDFKCEMISLSSALACWRLRLCRRHNGTSAIAITRASQVALPSAHCLGPTSSQAIVHIAWAQQLGAMALWHSEYGALHRVGRRECPVCPDWMSWASRWQMSEMTLQSKLQRLRLRKGEVTSCNKPSQGFQSPKLLGMEDWVLDKGVFWL